MAGVGIIDLMSLAVYAVLSVISRQVAHTIWTLGSLGCLPLDCLELIMKKSNSLQMLPINVSGFGSVNSAQGLYQLLMAVTTTASAIKWDLIN